MNDAHDKSAFEIAHARICELIDRFEKYARDNYLQPGYQEAEARKDFIDPMLKALGWDVDHEREHNPYEQEVKVERGVRDAARAQKRADYAFYLAPNFRDVRFFVEAKKPSVDLERSVDAHFQTWRYGYSANTPLAVLTDFEQIRILDCRLRPHPDSALDQAWKSWRYTDFRDSARFAEFYWLFSREAHADGSYQRRIDELPKPKGGAKQRGLFKGGYQAVDASFLAELEDHRSVLAKAFKKADQSLDSDALTGIVQRTLDRLVFLRFLEDKQIETEIGVSHFGKGKGAWADFQAASRRLDNIYNGIVFKRMETLDDPGFAVDDAVFADVCESLAAENSPYNFDAIPIHILGSIYERFLGSVISATAEIEPKPEVRKAGGVYYTPEYIVRYIVAQTVGRQIVGKSPGQVAKLRFADIACGSGSFLLGVFDELLRHHAEWYNRSENDKRAKKDGCVRTDDGLWRLSLGQRRAILQNNIFGVDIDRQAVEVAQLSLFLKLLEDERATSARQYQLDYARDANLKKLLPDLSGNIVCGNSLIGWDIAGLVALDLEDEHTLNPLTFKDAFPAAMRDGGFDAVVGNPPYGAAFSTIEANYLRSKYEFSEYQSDSYVLFLESAITKLRTGGLLGLIIPNTWLLNLRSPRVRQVLFETTQIEEIVHFKKRVFEQATVDTEIVIIRNMRPDDSHQIMITIEEKNGIKIQYPIPQSRWRSKGSPPVNIYERPEIATLADKLKELPLIDSLLKITQGTKPFQVGKGVPRQTREIVNLKPYVSTAKQDATFRPLLRGSLIQRYQNLWNNDYWIGFGDWLAEPRYSANYDAEEKILVRQTGDSLVAMIDGNQFIARDNLYTLVVRDEDLNLKIVLAILNSKFLNWFYQNIVNPERGEALAQVKRGHLAVLPLPASLREGKKNSGLALTSLVDQMLAAKQQQAAASGHAREIAARKCAALDRQIDALVYALYGLTDDEIALVEGHA